MRKVKIFLIVVGGLMVLSACGGKDLKKGVEKAKKDFEILYTYEESKIMPVIKEEKTPEELAKDYLQDRIGLSDGENPEYKEQGVLRDQGVFIESAIYDGEKIPNITAMSQETKDRIKNDREDRSLQRRIDEFEELEMQRAKVLNEQYKEDNTKKDFVEDEIRKRVEEYKQDAEEGTDESVEEDIDEIEDNEEEWEIE